MTQGRRGRWWWVVLALAAGLAWWSWRTSFELPPLRVARERVAVGEVSGDLGFGVQAAAPGEELDGRRYVVSSVKPGGAAARAGVVVGDEIVTVDGAAVAGAAGYLYDTLTRVSAGTTVQLGLGRGVVVAVVAGG